MLQTSMKTTVLKFSSEDCGTCHRMSFFDEKVVQELGLDFISVKMQDTEAYRKYRKILLAKYPSKEGMGWPTYLFVNINGNDFEIIGEIKGGMQKGDFRLKASNILND